MTTMAETNVTTQVYRVYIRATPQKVWEAITQPEWSQKYGYGGSVEYDLRTGGSYRAIASDEMQAAGSPEVAIDGEVIEADAPHKLVQTFRMLMDEQLAQRRLHAGYVRARRDPRGPHEAHADARARGRAAAGEPDVRGPGRRRRGRWLELGAQQPQVAARDRRRVRALTPAAMTGGPRDAGLPHAAACLDHRMTGPGEPPPTSSPTPSDVDPRMSMAAERTWLAWWRTALAATVGALGVGRLAPELLDVAPWPYVVLGTGYAGIAIGLLVTGAQRQRELERALERGSHAPLSFRLVALFTGSGVLLALLTVILVVAQT